MQALAEVQETPARLLLPRFPLVGLGTTDHVLPFHDSTRVRDGIPAEAYPPTAVQLSAAVQETPLNALPDPGCGLGTTAQVLPFQDSISGLD